MNNQKYIQILQFIEAYGGEKYKEIEKCKNDEERSYMLQGAEAGKKARASFEEIVKKIGLDCELVHKRISQWQNSGNFVRYFWCQLKDAEHIDNNISISVFAENSRDGLRFRVSVELAVEKASISEKDAYKQILDIPLKDNLVYISGGNNEKEFRLLDVHDNAAVQKLNLKKVQVSFVVNKDDCKDDESVLESLRRGASDLLEYYNYAIGVKNQNSKKQKVNSNLPTNKSNPRTEKIIPSKEPEIKADTPFNLTDKEAIARIKAYISFRGFTYPDNLIENFYLSLKIKPFVILAGTSGTGKTRLVKLFAEAVGATEANGRYKMVSVRPDWSDGSDLFGHTDLNGNFIAGPVCSAFETAMNEPDKPVFLCLDEMNLARVEYYLSDFLSVIESRERGDDGKITTSAIAQYEGGIPDNLYLIGTVNMDETTFPFSKKVLDRANTIEFNYVELVPKFEGTLSPVKPLDVPNRFLQTEYLVLERDCADEQAFVTQICDKLQRINEILRKANAHVGYRVRDEIVFYMLNNKKAENLLTEEQAFDNEIMQKILPRIQGSAVSFKDMLIELFKFCMGNQVGVDQDNGNVSKQMENKADSATYKESAKKIGYMMKRYEEDGFTSYWL